MAPALQSAAPMPPPAPPAPATLRPAQALLHPLWLAALVLHVVNDHVLKGAGILPGVVTGKLSDVAILLTTPTVLAVLLGVRSERAWRACHAAMGALFVALEYSDAFTAIFRSFIALFGFGWVTWRDWTDLLVLPTLFVSAQLFGRAARRSNLGGERARSALPTWRRFAELALVGAASLASLATSSVACPENVIDPDVDGDGVRWSADCDDRDPERYPGAVEIVGDGIDQDCDGVDLDGRGLACSTRTWPVVTVEAPSLVAIDGPVLEAQSSCTARSGSMRAVQVFVPAFDAPIARLRVFAEGDGELGISALRDCREAASELACVDASAVPLELIVDASGYVDVLLQGTPGTVTIRIEVEPLLCGDGLVVEPEQCDDGNLVGGDGCNPLCELEPGFGGGA
jgi:cysteine-rich repeat protein